ncbi:protein FAM13A isoform X3 [Scyliorhinus torazame]|uniref:protein FAM13A isoform X3 n=1 Tax=Scyliorhinus torazame TaxID=75743 RepID=UPI003B5B20EE
MGAGAITVCQNRTAVRWKEDVKRIMAHPLSTQRPRGGGKVFGVSLCDLQQQGKMVDGVPLVVQHMVGYLQEYGLEQEGLFRVNGNVKVVEQLRQRYDAGEKPDLAWEADVCSVASLLKLFLRELPDSLIISSLHSQFMQLNQDHSGNEEELQWLLRQLPDVNYSVLKFLCHFLTQVAAAHRINRMTVYNLATVFGPNVFHVSPGFEGIKEQNISNKLMATLLENYDVLFENADEMEAPPEVQTRVITVQTKKTRPEGSPGAFLVPQPEYSSGTPYSVWTQPAKSPSLEEMESSEELESSIKDLEINSSSQEDDRPMSPFYLSTHVPSVNTMSSAGDFIERTIRSAVEQHLFDAHGSGGQSSEESETGTSSSTSAVSARQRRRHLKEQDEYWRSKEMDDINKENIPSTFSTNEEGRSGLLDPSQANDKKIKESNSSYIEESMKPKRQKSSCKFSELNENQDSPEPMESSSSGSNSMSPCRSSDPSLGESGPRGILSFLTQPEGAAERERKESTIAFGSGEPFDHIRLTLNSAMRIQESAHQNEMAKAAARSPDAAGPEGSAAPDIPRLDLSGLAEGQDWGEPVPAHPVWQDPDADSEEARVSPQVGRLIRHLLEEDSDPMLSPRFYAYGQSQQFLNDTEVPPSPPNSHSFMRRRSSSLGSYDDEREELTPAQMTRRIQNLKKKIRRFEEKFEDERRYRPSHSDKATNPEVLKWMNELSKLRKQLKESKLKVSEEDVPPMRQRSNTLPKSFGSRLEKGPEKEPDKKPEVAEKAQKPAVDVTLEVILKKLQDKRAEVARPEDIKDMTRDEIASEKVALQKGLLYFESIHGRPVTRTERQIMKPLYDRYRLVKQILSRATSIPVIGSPSSKRRSPLLKPIIEDETASFIEDLKEEEDGSEDDCNARIDSLVTGKPAFTIRSFLDQLDDDTDGFESPTEDRTPTRCSLDLRLSTLHSASMPELLKQLQEARADKKRLRKTLRDFEDTFFQENGRNVQKEDRAPMAEEYSEYKHVKAKLRLLEVLISKQDPSKVI